MLFRNYASLNFLAYLLKLSKPHTQTSIKEREALKKYAKNKRKVAELGVYQGVTASELSSVIHPEGKYFAVDPYFNGKLGVNFDYLIAKKEVSRSSKGEVIWIKELGHNAPNNELLKDEKFDFIFIDGDHSYDGLRKDWESWKPHIALKGIVALHDTIGDIHLCQKYMEEEILTDKSFKLVEQVESLSVFEKIS